jgi:hypothetical protein
MVGRRRGGCRMGARGSARKGVPTLRVLAADSISHGFVSWFVS